MRYHRQNLVAGLALCFVTSLASSSAFTEEASPYDGTKDNGTAENATDPIISSSASSEAEEDFITPGLVPYMKLRTFGEERLSWLSGGNHPNHKWVEIKIEDGVRLLIVHEDNTYGTVRMDYILDIDHGGIEVSMVRSPGISQKETLTLPVYDSGITDRLSYTGALYHMVEIVAKVAEGNDLGYVVLPPRPELNETEAFLKELMRRCMI